jgi:2-oxoglutarate ferredoxin oxidoreductase subunit alpha
MKRHDTRFVCLRIAGEGGEGVISAGELLTQVAGRLGMHIQTYKTFPSEIRGGMAVYQIRVGPEVILSQGDHLDVLVAFNREGFDRNIQDLGRGGVLIYDFEEEPSHGRVSVNYPVPMGKLAVEAGSKKSKNMVALGAICELFGFPLDGMKDGIRRKFEGKGTKIVESNITALDLGATYVRENIKPRHEVRFPEGSGKAKVVLSGNEAIAFGALAAGCRFFAGYPITPATEVMEWLAKYLPRVGGSLVQAEDEIASMAMCLGASFAGKTSLTSTSGPGLALMTEALGLASMAEIPTVVVDVQRAGPSTGMPTKAEQGDLYLAIYGAHSTAKRVVIAPTGVEDAFYQTIRAFNIAVKYQTPVIILSEQSIAYSKQSMPRPDFKSIDVFEEEFPPEPSGDEGWPMVDEITMGEGYPMTPVFPRYLRTASGVSPRSVPGMKGREYRATGLEHDEYARPRYGPKNRKARVDKRLQKIEEIRQEYGDEIETIGDPDAEIALTSWGPTASVVRHAVLRKIQQGAPIKAFFPRMLCPMPDKAMRKQLQGVKRVLVCEMNAEGQYAKILRHRYGLRGVHGILKDHGMPFLPGEITPYIDMAVEEGTRI